MKMTFPEHSLIKGDRVVHVRSGRLATFTGERKEVKGVLFDFFIFDDNAENPCYFYPTDIIRKFKLVKE